MKFRIYIKGKPKDYEVQQSQQEKDQQSWKEEDQRLLEEQALIPDPLNVTS